MVPAAYHDRLPGIVDERQGRAVPEDRGLPPGQAPNWVQPLEGHEKLRNESGRTPEAPHRRPRPRRLRRRGALPEQGPDDLGDRATRSSPTSCAGRTTTGRGRRSVRSTTAWRRWPAWPPAALEETIAEIQRCAALGFKGLCLPCKPVFGPPNVEDLNYNLNEFEPLWDCIEDVDLPVTFHVSTGRDPRTARSHGGAVINYTVHSLSPTMEPLINICASGVAERHPKLRFGGHRGRHRLGAVDARGHGRGATASTTCGCGPSWSCCPANTSAARASPVSRRTCPASTWPGSTTWSTTSCGPTTSPTTRDPGRTRRRPSSGRWATSTTPSGPRSSGSTRTRLPLPIPERYLGHADAVATQAVVAAGTSS